MFRVLSAQLAHETNTFSVKRTSLDDYRSRALHFGPAVRAAFEGTNTEIGAHLAAAELFGWSLVQPIACSATPSGRTERSDWHFLRDRLLSTATSGSGTFDGAVIALHGAMVAEDEDDAEGALLEELRHRLGADVPIMVTVDLHANISERMVRHCNGLLAFRTYPHVDQHEVGLASCRMLQTAMQHRAMPNAHVWRLPTLIGCDFGRSDGMVMPKLLSIARNIRDSDPRCLALEICVGFPWSDVPFAGPSVVATWSDPEPPVDDFVAPLLKAIWETRDVTSVDYLTPDEAVILVAGWNEGRPLVLADAADNPGAGGYGDSIVLLAALLEAGQEGIALAAICDGESAAKAVSAGAGATLQLELGGKFEATKYGGPLRCEGEVISVSDGAVKLSGPMMNGVEVSLGPSAVLRIGGILVVVVTNNMQVFDRSVFVSQGIDPLSQRVLVVKSSHHFRSDFDELAGGIVLVDAGGPVSPNLNRSIYSRLRRPIEPFDSVKLPKLEQMKFEA